MTGKDKFDELFPLLYPRVYVGLGAYPAPKRLASFLTANAVNTVFLRKASSSTEWLVGDNANELLYLAASPLIQHQVPHFFVWPELLNAVLHTDLPRALDWKTMKLPHEAGVFVLPPDSTLCPAGGHGSCEFLLWCRIRKGKMPPIPISIPGLTSFDVPGDAFVLAAFFATDNVWVYLLNDLYPTIFDMKALATTLTPPGGSPIDATTESVMNQISTAVFGTLLVMTLPGMLEPEKRLKTIRSGPTKASTRTFWEPNVVGRNYKAKVVGETVHGPGGPWIGTSPKDHWRRGHHKFQACGREFKDHRYIWIEPVYVRGRPTIESSEPSEPRMSESLDAS